MREKISKKQLREFGMLIGFGFPFLIGWLLPAITGHGFRVWTILIGFPALIMGLTFPGMLHYPYKVWIKFGNVMGWINGKIILGLVFLLVLQPVAFVMFLTGYDPLRTKRKGENTYREKRKDHQIDFTRIF